jgi:hypothetical protein
MLQAHKPLKTRFYFGLISPLRRRVAAEQTRLLTLMACFVLQSVHVCTHQRRQQETVWAGYPFGGQGQPDSGERCDTSSASKPLRLREQHTVHVQARHSMQQYVPVGCVPCKQQHWPRLVHVGSITEQSDSAFIGGPCALTIGFEELRSVDAKAPVAAFRSDRQAMRRSRRCVSQALRPDSSQASPWSSFSFPSRASPRRRVCTPAVSRRCKQALITMDKSQSPLRALAAPPSTVAC